MIKTLKTRLNNTTMISGKKKTGEKILLKFAKRLQKSTNKSFKNVLQSAIINVTPTFKLTEQVIKKGKRKSIRMNPVFISSNALRLTASVKHIKSASYKNQKVFNFYEKLADEVLSSFLMKSHAVTKKTELQKQILMNKRYLSKFRW